MSLSLLDAIKKIAGIDLFKVNPTTNEIEQGTFVGRPFQLDYDRALILVADSWKHKCGGLPQGCFLLAYYENEEKISEALLLRILRPTRLPTDNDVVGSMVEYYKDNLKTSGKNSQIDNFTRYEFGFSGLECRILGTFYKNNNNQIEFGADVENFYSAHHYRIFKPSSQALELIANFREGTSNNTPSDVPIGKVRYSSSLRNPDNENVPVYVAPRDFLGKRTALFGMTRTGKSNTVKKIIQATVTMSDKSNKKLDTPNNEKTEEKLEPFSNDGFPKYPVGQIIFDINGEYANPNLQDAGTAIYELYKERTVRFSTIEKPGFKVLKVNFYNDPESGFSLIQSHLDLESKTGDYVRNFLSIGLSPPESEDQDRSAKTRYERKRAAYFCCLHRAGFKEPPDFKIKFPGNKKLNIFAKSDGSINPSNGVTLKEATNWFLAVWDNYENEFFKKYKEKHGEEWANEELKAILVFLSRKRKPKVGGSPDSSGYLKLRPILQQHTDVMDKPFEQEIIDNLREGKIIIIDLSQGNPQIQELYSKRICRKIFEDSMSRFISNKSNNFIQFYFEEAHNLFPKKEDKDLSQIYNRIAKEGAKLNLGMIYATQEVSSISSNILKNTQNWFIAHLNNEDETKEIKKYYDFGDFTESLIRFSASNDKGFVRMKTYSNPYIVPVQIDRFPE
jgi:hypothetical protein